METAAAASFSNMLHDFYSAIFKEIVHFFVVVVISFNQMSKRACDTIMQVFESGFIDEDSGYSLELEALKTTCRQKNTFKNCENVGSVLHKIITWL